MLTESRDSSPPTTPQPRRSPLPVVEPADREVTAVEPSELTISQRRPGAAAAIQATAEDLPFEDDSFDATMAIITVHHWANLEAGLTEMARVARRRVVILTFDPAPLAELWLVRDYFPQTLAIHGDAMPPPRRCNAADRGARKDAPMSPEWLTDRLCARCPLPSDEPAYMALFLNPEVGVWLRPEPLSLFTIPQVREMLRDDIRHWDEHPFGPWALIDRESGALVGRGGLQSTVVEGEPVVELPWTIAPDRWGSGLAIEAAQAAIAWARSLELDEVVTMTLPHNRASRRVAENAGLRFAGEIEHHGLAHVLYRLMLTEVK